MNARPPVKTTTIVTRSGAPHAAGCHGHGAGDQPGYRPLTLQRPGVPKHLSDGNVVCGLGIEGGDAHRVTAGRGVSSRQGSLRRINKLAVRPSGADSPDVRDKQTTHQPRDHGAAH